MKTGQREESSRLQVSLLLMPTFEAKWADFENVLIWFEPIKAWSSSPEDKGKERVSFPFLSFL